MSEVWRAPRFLKSDVNDRPAPATPRAPALANQGRPRPWRLRIRDAPDPGSYEPETPPALAPTNQRRAQPWLLRIPRPAPIVLERTIVQDGSIAHRLAGHLQLGGIAATAASQPCFSASLAAPPWAAAAFHASRVCLKLVSTAASEAGSILSLHASILVT